MFLNRFSLDTTDFDEDPSEIVEKLLLKWRHVFAESDLNLGSTKTVGHEIRLTEEEPFKERYRRIPPNTFE